jgi:hypothetical protein
MGGIELKTDSLQRWMMYSKDAYGSGRIFPTTEQKQAVEQGKKFSQQAYADTWARDGALVQRVRAFLGKNFYWHQRLAKNGTALEVIHTLQTMIRGESVVLVADQLRTGGAWARPAPESKGLPSFREQLMTKLGMSYDAATAYIDRYDDMVDKANATAARYANPLASPLADAASELTDIATSLSNAMPFEYGDDVLSGGSMDLAGNLTPNTGPDGSWYTNPGSGQMRMYGGRGFPVVDFDFDHDHGQGIPHAHNWEDNGGPFPIRGPGVRFSPLP